MTEKKTKRCSQCSGSGTYRYLAGYQGMGIMGIPRYVNRTCSACDGTGRVSR